MGGTNFNDTTSRAYRQGGGAISVPDGGTGNTTLEPGGILIGNGTVPVYTLAPADGQTAIGSVANGPQITPVVTVGRPLNISILNGTTVNPNDSIVISGQQAALSNLNMGHVALMSTITTGRVVSLIQSANVTMRLTSAHWGLSGSNVNGVILRVVAINDAGTLKWGIAYQGGRSSIANTDTTATAASVTTPATVYVNTALTAGTWPMTEIGWFTANFVTASTDWTVQTGATQMAVGSTADGIWQPWVPVHTGFSVAPTMAFARWTSFGRRVIAEWDINVHGTSNLTTWTMTFPIYAARVATYNLATSRDNSVSSATTPAQLRTVASSGTFNLYKDVNQGAWAAQNEKGAVGSITYEAI